MVTVCNAVARSLVIQSDFMESLKISIYNGGAFRRAVRVCQQPFVMHRTSIIYNIFKYPADKALWPIYSLCPQFTLFMFFISFLYPGYLLTILFNKIWAFLCPSATCAEVIFFSIFDCSLLAAFLYHFTASAWI